MFPAIATTLSERYKGKRTCPNTWHSWLCRVVGTAVLTFGVNSLWSRFYWPGCLSRLGISIPILSLYLLFVHMVPKTWMQREKHRNDQMTASQWRIAARLAVVAATIVLSNVMITVRFKCGRTNWTWHCPNCWGYISSHAICWDLGRISLLPINPALPRSLVGSFEGAYGLFQMLIRVSI